MTFLFPFPSHSHRITPIPIPTHSRSSTTFVFPFSTTSISILTYSHSHFRQRYRSIAELAPLLDEDKDDHYFKAEKYVYCVLNSKQNTVCSYSRSIVNQTHHSSVIIIITITAYHCSLFNVYQTVTACYCAKKQQAVHTAPGNFIFHL